MQHLSPPQSPYQEPTHDPRDVLQPQKSIRLYPWSALDTIERRNYLIKNLLEQGSLSVVYGESNSGKTFFALDIAAHISLGWLWQSRKTRKGNVLYIAAEGGHGIAERLEAFRKHYNLKQCGDMFVAMQTIILSGENNDCDQLIQKIKETKNVDLVVVDTLARAMAGGNENSSEDMGFFIRLCDKIREETGAHVMIVHHSGKDRDRGARGHSSLRAAVDTEIKVSQDNGIISAEIMKQRDGKTGDKLNFRLVQVEVGVDEDGDPMTSCVLEACDALVKTRQLSAQKRRALDILRTCIIEKGQKRIVQKDMGMRDCVRIDQYREYLKQENLSTSDKPDTVNKAITRAIDSLNHSLITGSYGDYIWIMDKEDKTPQSNSG
jgi:hypothetical protein